MSSGFDLYKTLMLDSRTPDLGIYNFTPIEVFAINQKLPFGMKLELEERYLKENTLDVNVNNWAKRLRKNNTKKNRGKKELRRLTYIGKPNMNPYSLMMIKSHLVLEKIKENPNALFFIDNKNMPTAPTIAAIQEKLRDKGFNTFFDFKKALRWLWLYYFINFEGNKEIIRYTSIMSQYTEDSFEEIESLSEEELQKRNENNREMSIQEKCCYYNEGSRGNWMNNEVDVKNNKSEFINNMKQIQGEYNEGNEKNNKNEIKNQKHIINNNNNNNSSDNHLKSSNFGNLFDYSKEQKIIIDEKINNNNNTNSNCDDSGTKRLLSTEEKNTMSNHIKFLTKNQLKGIVPVLKDYFTQNSNNNSKHFEFDIDKLNAEQLSKLKKYLIACVQENEKIQQLSSIQQSNTQKINNNTNISNYNRLPSYDSISNANIQSYQLSNKNDLESIKINKLKRDLACTSRRNYINSPLRIVKEKKMSFKRNNDNHVNINNSISNNQTISNNINKSSNKNDNTRNCNIQAISSIGNNPINSNNNNNQNFLTTSSVVNYTNQQQSTPLNNNNNQNNNNYSSDSGSFDFH